MMSTLHPRWEAMPHSDSLSTRSSLYRSYDIADAAFFKPITNIASHPRDVTSAQDDITYERRAPLSSTPSENNYAEIAGQDSSPQHRQQTQGIRYLANIPGNYMFNSNSSRHLPEIESYRPRDLTGSGQQNSPDSGLGILGGFPTTSTSISQTVSTSSLSGRPHQPPSVSQTKITELATIPLPDRRSRAFPDCEYYQTKPTTDKKPRPMLCYVLVMLISGLLYVALGIIAGYFIGIKGCKDCIIEDCLESDVPLKSIHNVANTTNLSSSTTTSSTTTSTTSTTSSTTAVTTTAFPESTTALSLCFQEIGFCRCGPFGGDAEREFSDRSIHLQNGNVTSFTVNHNDYFIGSIQFWYGKTAGPQHGYTTSGYEVKVDLVQNEVITEVQVDFTSGKSFLTRLEINTNLRRLGPYGGQGGLHMPTQGGRLLYVMGRAGAMLDQLTLIYDKCLIQ